MGRPDGLTWASEELTTEVVVDSNHVVLEALVGATLEQELQEKQREVSLLDHTGSPTYP